MRGDAPRGTMGVPGSTAPQGRGWLRRVAPAVLLLLLTLSSTPSAAQPSPAPVAVRYRVAGVERLEQRNAIVATGAAIEAVEPEAVVLTATPAELAAVRTLGFEPRPIAAQSDFPPDDAAYHTYDEMVAEIQAAEATRPSIVSLFSIGRSHEGRELWAAKVSDNVLSDEDEPEALFVGLYHAREHLTLEMTLAILRLLTEGYDPAAPEAQITRLVDTRQIYIVFALNPDGAEYDVAAGGYRYWRKNRQPNAGGSVGTDPNRNHGYRWGGAGASASPASETYRGAAPASAPEVAAIERFVDGRALGGQQRIRVAISFHTYGELILWPYGYQDAGTCGSPAPDMPGDDRMTLEALGEAMAATNGYQAQQSCRLYTTSGDFGDWAYGAHRIFAFTFEMFPCFAGCPGYGFYPPAALIAEQTARNYEAVLYLLERAACPYDAAGLGLRYCDATATSVWLPAVGR